MTRSPPYVAPNLVAVNSTRGRVPAAKAAGPPAVVSTTSPESATATVPSTPSALAVKGRWLLRAAITWVAVVAPSAIATVRRFVVGS